MNAQPSHASAGVPSPVLWSTLLALLLFAVGCGTATPQSSAPDASASTAFPGQTTAAAALTPAVFTGDGGACLKLGGACTAGADCCTGSCVGGACAYPACTTDGLACTSNGDCCSQSCASGVCAAINTTCRTLGNACTTSAECCSGLCTGGSCQASSFCGQPGDACSGGPDCCTGVCNVESGHTLGTCASSPPGGPANCGLADGQLCNGVPSAGGVVLNEAGLPRCGGPCCSRACAPWGPTGVAVCQPASGCHVVGDLCTRDSDCCGSAGLPGGSGKPVTCVITAPNTVGVCRNPMGCKPDGDVCKLKTMSCNSSCDCCSGNCETMDTCHQDNMGVPRCAAATCVNAGGACASSANCCNGAPCVPNAAPGGPAFVCAPTACVAACGSCSNNADCCPGSSCMLAPGSASGVCGPCGGGTTPGSDGGTPSGGNDSGPPNSDDAGNPGPGPGPMGGSPDAGDASRCALLGQICQTSSDCCNGIPCVAGRCQIPLQ